LEEAPVAVVGDFGDVSGSTDGGCSGEEG